MGAAAHIVSRVVSIELPAKQGCVMVIFASGWYSFTLS
jgi:hypothetical protein